MMHYQLHQPMNYLGITGFTQRDQVSSLIEIEDRSPASSIAELNGAYVLMAGVLVSDKTFHGITNKHPERYPKINKVKSIWHPDAFNVLHYCTSDPVLPEVAKVIDKCEIVNGMGIQFNVPWPDIMKLNWVRDSGIRIIMQIGEAALRATEGIANNFVQMMSPYYGIVEYVLFDMSGGSGRKMEPEMLLRYMVPLHETYPSFRLAVAGGLGPESLDNLLPFLPFRDKLSVDAESCLRDKDDKLNIERCGVYLDLSVKALSRRLHMIYGGERK